MNDDFKEIEDQLQSLKFKKKLVGGVAEADVWKKIEDLHMAYKKAFLKQGQAYQALINERNRIIEKLKSNK